MMKFGIGMKFLGLKCNERFKINLQFKSVGLKLLELTINDFRSHDPAYLAIEAIIGINPTETLRENETRLSEKEFQT